MEENKTLKKTESNKTLFFCMVFIGHTLNNDGNPGE